MVGFNLRSGKKYERSCNVLYVVAQASRLLLYFVQTRCLHHNQLTFCRSVLTSVFLGPIWLSLEGFVFCKWLISLNFFGEYGAQGIRTLDPYLAKVVLSQLS